VTALVLATRSEHKAAEVRAILEPLGMAVASLDDVECPPSPEEDGLEVFETFRANALAKARWFADRLGRPVLADDSGLRVDALDGRPGVRTKRFSGRTDLDGPALDQANNERLLQELRQVPEDLRGARYVCCAAAAWPEGRELAAMGSVRGVITRTPAGTHGFGYDPLFWVPEIGARFAEVAPAAKNALSHRGRAFRSLAALLGRIPWET
jgi:XTP/dITP diphosphohydrolase